MIKAVAIALCIALILAVMWLANEHVAPFCLNSRIERLGERALPKVIIERGQTVYCRMKADDFRFPLPPGSRATNAMITGGFDTVDGSVEALFESTNQVTASQYESWVSGKVAVGGRVTAEPIAGGLLVSFHYFGDK
jgi:hypothetical protein